MDGNNTLPTSVRPHRGSRMMLIVHLDASCQMVYLAQSTYTYPQAVKPSLGNIPRLVKARISNPNVFPMPYVQVVR
jgi:hypothetical protein